MGIDLDRGMKLQMTVPRGTWQGLRVKPGGTFALLGTTVAPGFEFADCELANRQLLQARYPSFSGMIEKLTR